MRYFQYWRDPFCWGSCFLYALNRWWLKPLVSSAFLHNHFDDLLLIPAALPLVLWIQRKLRLRLHDKIPSWSEIIIHTGIWSLIAEWLMPRFDAHATGDWMDVVMYFTGGVLAGIGWTFFYKRAVGFDSIARFYTLLEKWLAGDLLQRSRTHFFPEPTDRVLIAGEGHGRFLEALLKRYPNIKVTCIEQSHQMQVVTRNRLKKAGLADTNVHYITEDILMWEGEEEAFDCIVTHHFLDCFDGTTLEKVIEKLQKNGTKNGTWLISDFQIPKSFFAKWRARFIIEIMLWFFQLVTGLPARKWEDPRPILEKFGFHYVEGKTFEWGLLYTERRMRTHHSSSGK